MIEEKFINYINNTNGRSQSEATIKKLFPLIYIDIINWLKTYNLHPKNFRESLKYYVNNITVQIPEPHFETDYLKLIEKYKHKYSKTSGLQKPVVKNSYKDLYKGINDYTINFTDAKWPERLYLFFNQIKEIPLCKLCGKTVNFSDKHSGYNDFCSRECIDNFAKTNICTKNKIRKTLFTNCAHDYNEKYPNFNYIFEKNKNYLIVKNFCEHGDLSISTSMFKYIYIKDDIKIYCEKCREQFIHNYIPTKDDINFYMDYFKKNFNSNNSKESYIKKYYLKLYKCIIHFTSHLPDDAFWVERIYLFKNNMLHKPICKYHNCTNNCTYRYSNSKYNTFCVEHTNIMGHHVSPKEIYKDTDLYYQYSYEYDFLEKYYGIFEIKSGIIFKYIKNGKSTKYYSDYFIPYLHLIVEIKNSYLYNKDVETNLLKRNSAIKNGYNFIFIIDKNYENFNNILKYGIKPELSQLAQT